MKRYLPNSQGSLDISIIIVSFNTKDLTLSCISSILEAKPQVRYEIIVVDNGSTDGSVEAIENSKLQIQNYKLIGNKENKGFAKANNQGVRVAKGKYVLLLNSDTVVKKQALEKLVEFTKNTPDAGVVGTKLLNPDGSIQASVYNFPSLLAAFKEYWLGMKGNYEKYVPSGDEPLDVDAVVGASFLITPEALTRVGLLDERYFMFFEDLDYCRRVKEASLKVYYLPNAEIIHYLGESGKKLSDRDTQWRRLIPSSKVYHGVLRYYLINTVIWSGIKFRKLL